MNTAWWMWFIMDVLAVIILGGAIAYATHRWTQRPKDPAVKEASDQATKRLYHPHDDMGNKPLSR